MAANTFIPLEHSSLPVRSPMAVALTGGCPEEPPSMVIVTFVMAYLLLIVIRMCRDCPAVAEGGGECADGGPIQWRLAAGWRLSHEGCLLS